jgi:hypothetical protein
MQRQVYFSVAEKRNLGFRLMPGARARLMISEAVRHSKYIFAKTDKMLAR